MATSPQRRTLVDIDDGTKIRLPRPITITLEWVHKERSWCIPGFTLGGESEEFEFRIFAVKDRGLWVVEMVETRPLPVLSNKEMTQLLERMEEEVGRQVEGLIKRLTPDILTEV